MNVTGRNSGAELNPPSYINHQSNLFQDPKLSPIQKRNSATPSIDGISSNKDHYRTNYDNSIKLYDTGVQEITEIPDDYLSQSSVLKHLAKEVKVPSPTIKEQVNDKKLQAYDVRPPPPDYPEMQKKSTGPFKNRGKIEKFSLSKSQPDLSKIGLNKIGGDLVSFRRGVSVPRPRTKGREEYELKEEPMWTPNEMFDTLIKENTALKFELENCYLKIGKAQKVRYSIATITI